MKYKIVDKNNKSYIIYNEQDKKICSEGDMLDVIGLCFENKINLVMINRNSLAEEFYDLKTKLLGMCLQKFINYNVRVAFIVD